MNSSQELDLLSREDLYSMISGLKRENSCLTSDLIRCEIHLKKFQKYFEDINEKIGPNEEFLYLVKEIRVLNDFIESKTIISINKSTKLNKSDTNKAKVNSKSLPIKGNDISKSSNRNKSNTNKTATEAKSSNSRSLLIENNGSHINEMVCHKNGIKCELSEDQIGLNGDQNKSEVILQISEQEISNGVKREYVCQWIGCHKRYITKKGFLEHKQTHCPLNLKCAYNGCDKMFKSQNTLRSHILNIHEPRFKCDVNGCEYRTGFIKLLNCHKSTHSDRFPFICTEKDCSKKYRTELKLKYHLIERHPEQFKEVSWIECEEMGCDFKCKVKREMNRHLKTQHIKPFKCEFCLNGFGSKVLRNNHINVHHKKSKEHMKIQCEWYGCERRFSSRHQMKEHMNSHTNQVVYTCPMEGCGRTYNLKHSFDIHVMRHNREKVNCHWPQCEFATNRKDLLKRHLEKHLRQ